MLLLLPRHGVSDAMTAPALPPPALASVQPAAPAAARGAAAGMELLRAGGGAAPAVLQAFSALFLGLRAGSGGPVTPPPATHGPRVATQPVDLPVPGPGGVPPAAPEQAPLQPPPTAAATVPGADLSLPDSGQELPPVEALLAALAAPLAPAAGSAQAPVAEGAATPAAPAATPTAAGLPGQAVAQALRDLPAGAQLTAAEIVVASGPELPEAPRWHGALEEAISAERRAGARPGDVPSFLSSATPAGELPPRLDALLAAMPRTLVAADARPADAVLSVGLTPAGIAPPGPPGAIEMARVGAEPLPVLAPAGDPDAWSRGLGERLLLMAERNLQTATIRLQPEQLGPVEIRLRVNDDGAAQVHFSAAHAQTRDALDAAIPRLRELFAEQGLSLAHANVDAGRGGFAQRGFDHVDPAWSPWREPEPERAVVAATLGWTAGGRSERRLDVLV
jgi:flagellar hook-length control protein FliK